MTSGANLSRLTFARRFVVAGENLALRSRSIIEIRQRWALIHAVGHRFRQFFTKLRPGLSGFLTRDGYGKLRFSRPDRKKVSQETEWFLRTYTPRGSDLLASLDIKLWRFLSSILRRVYIFRLVCADGRHPRETAASIFPTSCPGMDTDSTSHCRRITWSDRRENTLCQWDDTPVSGSEQERRISAKYFCFLHLLSLYKQLQNTNKWNVNSNVCFHSAGRIFASTEMWKCMRESVSRT